MQGIERERERHDAWRKKKLVVIYCCFCTARGQKTKGKDVLQEKAETKTKTNIFFAKKIKLTQSYTTMAKVPLSGTEAQIFQPPCFLHQSLADIRKAVGKPTWFMGIYAQPLQCTPRKKKKTRLIYKAVFKKCYKQQSSIIPWQP